NPLLPNYSDAQIGNVSLGGHFDVSSFGNGGTLTLTVDRLRVGQPTRATGETALTADAFGPGGRFAGFRDLRLGAITARRVDAGPAFAPLARTLVATTAATQLASGRPANEAGDLMLLPADRRLPVNITLSTIAPGSLLRVAPGATVATEAKGT